MFDTGQYVITTKEHGSTIEPLGDAIEAGHEHYGMYWKLLSIETASDSCGGGTNRLSIHTYFERDPGGIFGWGESYVAASAALSAVLELWGDLTVNADGWESLGIGLTLRW